MIKRHIKINPYAIINIILLSIFPFLYFHQVNELGSIYPDIITIKANISHVVIIYPPSHYFKLGLENGFIYYIALIVLSLVFLFKKDHRLFLGITFPYLFLNSSLTNLINSITRGIRSAYEQLYDKVPTPYINIRPIGPIIRIDAAEGSYRFINYLGIYLTIYALANIILYLISRKNEHKAPQTNNN